MDRQLGTVFWISGMLKLRWSLTLATIYILPNGFQGKITPFKIIAINNCFPALLYTRYVYVVLLPTPSTPLFPGNGRRTTTILSFITIIRLWKIEGNMMFYLILLQSSMTAHVKGFSNNFLVSKLREIQGGPSTHERKGKIRGNEDEMEGRKGREIKVRWCQRFMSRTSVWYWSIILGFHQSNCRH